MESTGVRKERERVIRLHVLRERKLEDPQRLEGYDRCPSPDDPHRGNEQAGRDEKSGVSAGYGKREAFYRVAQVISEFLPIESKEKKRLDGFLAGRE